MIDLTADLILVYLVAVLMLLQYYKYDRFDLVLYLVAVLMLLQYYKYDRFDC